MIWAAMVIDGWCADAAKDPEDDQRREPLLIAYIEATSERAR
jgi:hypothetical protein